MSWSKEQRQIAKDDGKCLIRVEVDGRLCLDVQFGVMRYSDVVSADAAQRLLKLVTQLIQEAKEHS